jgi:hypothetical protein
MARGDHTSDRESIPNETSERVGKV